MKKIKDILVVSHFALVRSELCDIINASTEYRAESYEWSLSRALNDTRESDVLRIIDMDSLDKNSKEELKEYIKTGVPAGTIFIFGTLDLKSIMNEPYTEKGFIFVSKMPGHLTENARFIRSFSAALEKNGIDFKNETKESDKALKSTEQQPENVDDSGKSIFGRTSIIHDMSRIGEITRAKDIKPERHLRCQLDSNGKIADSNLIVAIASSTGGPKALQDLIPLIAAGIDAPLIITQHMPAGFTKSMAVRLNEISEIEVKEAEDGDVLKKGCLYVAPGGKHLTVVPFAGGHRVVLSDEAPVGGLKPCADIMYKSLETSNYSSVLCVVLTGMGEDGSKGIVHLGEKKSIYVVSQDSDSCVVYGMPKAIAEVGYSDEVLPLLSIAKSIEKKVGVK